MADVVWLQEALDDIDQIVAYIDASNRTAAEKMGRKLFALGESLTVFPNRGRPGRNGTRELPSVPPYVLIYEVVGEVVTILTIRHSRRRPLD